MLKLGTLIGIVGISVGLLSILAADSALSDPTVPYDPGDTQRVAAAAARITNIGCIRTYDGYVFTFGMEVFSTCWKPIYSLRLFETDGTPLRPLACPTGWSIVSDPLHLTGDGDAAFETKSDPVRPGQKVTGFAVSCQTCPVVFRWYPADENGTLVGKASKENLSCPLGVEAGTWGSIKSKFR